MSAAAVVCAIALMCLIVFFVMETRPKKTMSMLDLAEFKDLPGELRAMIRSMLPKPALLKKQWANMTAQQKQMVLQNLSQQIPRPQPPGPPPPPAPSMKITHEPAPAPAPAPAEIEDVSESGLKPGFLLTESVDKRQKKNTKNKKENKVVTLSDVGASDDETGPGGSVGDD
ncbi:hypothetical protein EBT25_06815 [bacterium]|nr:hypothetical protein [bacterium]